MVFWEQIAIFHQILKSGSSKNFSKMSSITRVVYLICRSICPCWKVQKWNYKISSVCRSGGLLVIPYVKGVSEALPRIYGSYGVQTCSKPTRILRQMWRQKTNHGKRTLLVQFFPSTAKARHLEGSVRNFVLGRLNVLSKPDSLNINVQAPSHQKSPSTSILNLLDIHYVDLQKVKILDREAGWFERGVKEAIYIRAYQPTLNKYGGRNKLLNSYDPVLTSLTSKVKN